MSNALVEVEGLVKRFSGENPLRRVLRRRRASTIEVLRDVSFTLGRDEFLALLGPNGAGKTTILKTIATLLLPDAGSVRVAGRDVVREPARVRTEIGYVLADERSFHWRLSLRQNLEFFAGLSGLRRSDSRARIDMLLARLDLSDMADRSFGSLSTGMKQRLAVARALLARPRVLLMDEPTRSIDAGHAAEVWRLVREEIAAVDGCLVLVTHNIQEALTLCGRVAILADGRVALDTTTDRLASMVSDLDGFVLAVRGLTPADLVALRAYPGVRDLRVASQLAGEQTLEVWTHDGDLQLAGFMGELTGMGVTICSLQRATPLQGVLERLALGKAERNGVHGVPV